MVVVQGTAARAADPPAVAEGLGRQPLAAGATNLLGGRLTVRLPVGAEVKARQVTVMSAPESEEDETRVVFDIGKERLVIMAHELFATASNDFERDVRATVAQWGAKGAEYRLAASPLRTLRAISVLPAVPGKAQDDAIFVRGAFVALPDGTVQTVFVYVNGEAARDLAGSEAAADRILATLAPGTKKLRIDGGERRLATLSPDAEIVVNLPRNMVVTRQTGPDFVVQRLRVLGALGTSPSSIGFYLGYHPSFEPGERKSDGVLLGKKIVWYARRAKPGLEALVALPKTSGPPESIHVWIVASSEDRLEALKRVAESMALVKKPKAK